MVKDTADWLEPWLGLIYRLPVFPPQPEMPAATTTTIRAQLDPALYIAKYPDSKTSRSFHMQIKIFVLQALLATVLALPTDDSKSSDVQERDGALYATELALPMDNSTSSELQERDPEFRWCFGS